MHMSVHGGKKLPWFWEPRFFGGVQVHSKLEFQGGGLYQIHRSKSPRALQGLRPSWKRMANVLLSSP